MHFNYKIYALLGHYKAYIGSSLLMFRANLLVPSSEVKNYHYMLHNNPEERRSHLLCAWSLNSQNLTTLVFPNSNFRLETNKDIYFLKYTQHQKAVIF